MNDYSYVLETLYNIIFSFFEKYKYNTNLKLSTYQCCHDFYYTYDKDDIMGFITVESTLKALSLRFNGQDLTNSSTQLIVDSYKTTKFDFYSDLFIKQNISIINSSNFDSNYWSLTKDILSNMDFFSIKILITDFFYDHIIKYHTSYVETFRYCIKYYNLKKIPVNHNHIVAIITLFTLMIENNNKLIYYDINQLNDIINRSKDILSNFSEIPNEYFISDINTLEEYISLN